MKNVILSPRHPCVSAFVFPLAGIIMIFQQPVDKGVSPKQYRDDDGGEYGCLKQLHGIGIIKDRTQQRDQIQGNKKQDAEEGENLFDFFHNNEFLSGYVLIIAESTSCVKSYDVIYFHRCAV